MLLPSLNDPDMSCLLLVLPPPNKLTKWGLSLGIERKSVPLPWRDETDLATTLTGLLGPDVS